MLVVFPKKQFEITIPRYFKEVNTSRSHINYFPLISKICINCLKKCVDPDQSASSEAF